MAERRSQPVGRIGGKPPELLSGALAGKDSSWTGLLTETRQQILQLRLISQQAERRIELGSKVLNELGVRIGAGKAAGKDGGGDLTEKLDRLETRIAALEEKLGMMNGEGDDAVNRKESSKAREDAKDTREANGKAMVVIPKPLPFKQVIERHHGDL